ncbi:hypothetical protein CHUAL_007353 [Chamberlinius hualienensis]
MDLRDGVRPIETPSENLLSLSKEKKMCDFHWQSRSEFGSTLSFQFWIIIICDLYARDIHNLKEIHSGFVSNLTPLSGC